MASDQQQQEPPVAAPEQPVEQQLPLAGDYKGLGGPSSVPLYTPSAFNVIIQLATIYIR